MDRDAQGLVVVGWCEVGTDKPWCVGLATDTEDLLATFFRYPTEQQAAIAQEALVALMTDLAALSVAPARMCQSA